MDLKSARDYLTKGAGFPPRRNVASGSGVPVAGCLFRDMMKDRGLDGCRNRTCDCPFAGKKRREPH
ncbi:MAG TPA: hypothetical protein PKN85_00830 [Syntrophorhabdaceae bacterium]|nr:hypothetical protein [Syntrophorhabdaceae bacterium]HOD74908.1 hypothetical protein [Syntrophorhabdaceae bacterium]